jgi:hypothetical protein
VEEETTRLRDQLQQAGGRLEDRLEGWLEEPPWDESPDPRDPRSPRQGSDPLDDWDGDGWDGPAAAQPPPRSPQSRPRRGEPRDDDPWI